jgi:hypothetical protein
MKGDTIIASPAFSALRDALPSDDVTVNARRPQFEKIFATLEKTAGNDSNR